MRARIVIILSILLFLIGLGTFYFVWIQGIEKQIWNQEGIGSLSKIPQDKPAILAIVSQSCNDDSQAICPSPESMDLKEFYLIEVLHGSKNFIELGYDDRFIPDIESPPVFYLLNPDGEIRDVRNTFPDEALLERWKKIR